MLNELQVFPVTASVALDWVYGRLSDSDILKLPPGREAVLFGHLPNLSDYRAGLRQVYDHWKAGAVCYVGRTGIPSVQRYLLKRGAIAMLRERNPAFGEGEFTRYIIPPLYFNRWMERLRFPSEEDKG